MSPAETVAADPGASAPRVIVYIEDNPRNIAFIEDLIGELSGVQLLTAANAELGIELVRAQHPNLVLMDIHLPGMDGFEALRRLRTSPETRDIPVIALSAARREESKRTDGSGFHSFFDKPVNVEALLNTLEKLLGGPASTLPAPRED
jgi:CheY-like chemotaxis protein